MLFITPPIFSFILHYCVCPSLFGESIFRFICQEWQQAAHRSLNPLLIILIISNYLCCFVVFICLCHLTIIQLLFALLIFFCIAVLFQQHAFHFSFDTNSANCFSCLHPTRRFVFRESQTQRWGRRRLCWWLQ